MTYLAWRYVYSGHFGEKGKFTMFNQQAALFHMEMCCHVFIHPAKSSSEPLSKTWSEFPLHQIKTGNLFCNRKPASDILSVVNLKAYKEIYKKVTKVATITGVQFCFELTNPLGEIFSLSHFASLYIRFLIYMSSWFVCTLNIGLGSYREILEGVEQEAQRHLGFIEQRLGLRDAC